jgi:3-methyladenine DNA glycosylase/8-oxoguanine DNA glycosylase
VTPDLQIRLRPDGPYDLRRSLFGLSWMQGDPTHRWFEGALWLARRWSGEGATLRIYEDGDAISVAAWGPGASAALSATPELLGLHDDPRAFAPDHPLLVSLLSQQPGRRMPRTRQVMDALVPTILGQLITVREASLRYRDLVRRYGEPAPGPGDRWLAPAPALLARMATWRFRQLEIGLRQAETLRRAAERASRLEEAVHMPLDAAMARLQAIPGIGPWTASSTLATALGDADTVITGDLHMPRAVVYALTGEEQGDDARMLALLEPFRPHRGRAQRLLLSAGPKQPQRGPQLGRDPRYRPD